MVIECSAQPKFKKGMRKPFEEILEKYGLHMGLNSICARFALIAEGLEEMLFLEKAKQFFVTELRREPEGPMDECHLRFAAAYASHSNSELLERVQELSQSGASVAVYK